MHQERIATLYLPFLRTVLDNAGRFDVSDSLIANESHVSEPFAHDQLFTLFKKRLFSQSSRDDVDSSAPTSLSTVFSQPAGDRAGSLRVKQNDVNSVICKSTIFHKHIYY